MGFFQIAKRHKALVGLLILLIIVIIILAQNRDYVQIKILFWSFSAQKVLFILGLMVFGYLVGKLIEFAVRSEGIPLF